MIDFRYHIVSIVAIFFARGAGVLLGAGPLKGEIDASVANRAETDRKALEDARQELIQAKALDKYRDDYVAKVTAGLTSGRLKDKQVTVVTMPQADSGVVDGITKTLEGAGAQVTTRVSLDAKLFDPEQRQLVEPLVNQLVTADVTFPKDSTTYYRAGQILARGIAAKGEGQSVDDDATKVLGGLGSSKLFSFKPTPMDRASLVVVVAAKSPTPTAGDTAYADAIDLAEGLDGSSAGVVIAGAPDSAADGGLLKAMRGDSDATKAVSSVDVADLPSGQATVVFALAEQADGKAGQYGAVDAKDGVAPPDVLVPER